MEPVIDSPPSWFQKWAKQNDEKMNGRFAAIDGRFDRLERLLLPASSDFFRDFPVLRAMPNGIQGVGVPTWTMMELKSSTEPTSRIFAVSSAHVGLKYRTVRETSPDKLDKNKRLFVEVPKEICAAGIKKVHLHKNLLGCEKGKGVEAWDICVVELNEFPKGITSAIQYPHFGSAEIPAPGMLLEKLFGCSSMESVAGSAVTTSDEENNPFLIFVLSEGEQGDSGTLLYTIGSGQVAENKLLGLFQGVSNSRGGANMRKRGKITPIPAFGELKELSPYPLGTHTHTDNWDSIALVIPVTRTARTYNISTYHKTGVTLTPVDKHAGKKLFGVIVDTNKELGFDFKGWPYGATSPGEGDGDWDGDGDDTNSLQQEMTTCGGKRNRDALDCN
jgi:hypothetical protein